MSQTKNGELIRVFYGEPHKEFVGGKERIIVLIGPPDITCRGPMFPPLEMLNFTMRSPTYEIIDNVVRYRGYIEEPPGWFERACGEANCSWFVQYVKRMAGGEKIPIETITDAYYAHNQKEILTVTYGTASQRFAIIT